MKKLLLTITFLSAFASFVGSGVAASGDLAISDADVWFSTSTFLEGQSVSMWVSVHNNSPYDLLGTVQVSTDKGSVGTDQPISALAGKTDEVFLDWVPSTYGTYNLTVTIIPWDSSSDNPANNSVQKQITVLQDTDGDGITNSADPDMDGDGVANEEDAFPVTRSESEDTDGDGQGNNADLDDDNDGTPDTEDEMPEDSRYTKDQDKDGIPDEEDEDIDGDGLSNEEEALLETDTKNTDSDADSAPDGADAFPTDPAEQVDTDEDGIGDNADTDKDGDSIENETDLDPMNPAPTASIDQDVFIADLGEEVVFSGSSSEDDSNIIQYIWSFGEKTLEGEAVSHSFDTTGLQVAMLTVYDENGQSDTTEVKVRVLDYSFLVKAGLFALLLILLAFYIIYRYTRRRPSKKGKNKVKRKS